MAKAPVNPECSSVTLCSEASRRRVRALPIWKLPPAGSGAITQLPTLCRHGFIDPDTVKILEACQTFASVEQHASRIAGVLSPAEVQKLYLLTETDLFVSERQVIARATTAGVAPNVRINCLAIPTRARSLQLDRALGSYLRNLEKFDRRACVLISDDSPSDAECNASRAVVDKLSKSTNCNVVFVGHSERMDYIRALRTRSDIPAGVLQFCLFGASGNAPAMGANRNFVSLYSTGQLVFSADDDTVCSPGFCPTGRAEAALNVSAEYAAELWCYPDRLSCLRAMERCDFDVLGMHEQLLGQPVGSAIQTHYARCSSSVNLKNACDEQLLDILRGEARIVATSNGAAGDCGMYSAAGVLMSEHIGTRARLLESYATFEQACSSREVIRQAQSRLIVRPGALPGMFMGLDFREMLPPCFPTHRNEDGVFAVCLHHCVLGANVAHLPFVMIHEPSGERAYSSIKWASLRLSDIVASYILKSVSICAPRDSSARYQAIGRKLMAVASMPRPDFALDLQRTLFTRASIILGHHRRLLERFDGYPKYWAEAIEREDERLRRSVLSHDYTIPSDVEVLRTSDAAEAVQNSLYRFGELLCWWPELVNRARQISRFP